MKKLLIVGFCCLGLVSGILFAQDSSNLAVSAAISSRYKLELSSNTVTFTRVANPMGTPVILQNEIPIQVTVKATTSRSPAWPQSFGLRIQAVGNLIDTSTGDTIPVGALTWSATGDGFVSGGTLVADTDVPLGTWNASGSYKGTIRFSFKDSANYAPGIYRLVVTLSVGTS